jgi:4-hydroxyphenylpyruvate dioxygenase
VWNLVRQADHPALGVILDSFHTLSLKGDPSAIRDIPGDKIFFVQMADAPILAMDVLEWSRHFRCFPGQGEMDLAGFLAPILATGYRGPLSLEIFNDGFRAAPPGRMPPMACVRCCTSKRRPACAGAGKHAVEPGVLFPRRRQRLRRRGVPRVRGRRSRRRAPGQLAQAPGLCRSRQAPQQGVRLLRQGDINIVLNAEPYSFGHNFFEAHGPSLCATALRVKDRRRP